MIAKLIVRGPSRTAAIQKLQSSLESYEIAGPITNVDFLKRVCEHPSFVAGDVETGFIAKHQSELFKHMPVSPEIFAQAAICALIRESAATDASGASAACGLLGLTSSFSGREFRFNLATAAGEEVAKETVVQVSQTGDRTFNVAVNDTTFHAVQSEWDCALATLVSFYPHRRLDTRFVFDDGKITAFQHGTQYRLQTVRPSWLEKALGIKDVAHSVIAPMPCRILRVEIQEGQDVQKDQALLVIESMKMETVIRSPLNATVARIVHVEGVSLLYPSLRVSANCRLPRIFAKQGQH